MPEIGGSAGFSARGIERAGASSQGSKASGSPRNSTGVSPASPGSGAGSGEAAPSLPMPESAPSLSGGLICASTSAFRSGGGTGSVPALPPQGVAGSRPATSAKLSTSSAEGSSTSCGAISRVISAKENPCATCTDPTEGSAAVAELELAAEVESAVKVDFAENVEWAAEAKSVATVERADDAESGAEGKPTPAATPGAGSSQATTPAAAKEAKPASAGSTTDSAARPSAAATSRSTSRSIATAIVRSTSRSTAGRAAGAAAACRWSCHQPFSEASPPVSSCIRGGRASTPWRCTQRRDSQATAPSSLRSRAPFSTRRSERRFCWGRGRTGAGREGGGVTAGLS
jgi:hypothetical protein